MTRNQTPYSCGHRAGLIGQEYIVGDRLYNSQDYLDWWRGWKDGKAARPQAVSASAPWPRPRPRWQKQPQEVRRREYLREVGRLGKVEF